MHIEIINGVGGGSIKLQISSKYGEQGACEGVHPMAQVIIVMFYRGLMLMDANGPSLLASLYRKGSHVVTC